MIMFFVSILVLVTFWTVPSLSSEYGGYQAPLEGMDVRSKHPNEYVVIFYANHTLEQHFRIIGRNLSTSPQFRQYTFGYQAGMDDQTRDEQVRRDPGVRMVETNRPVYAIRPDEIVDIDVTEPARNRTFHLSKREYRTVIEDNAPYGLQMLTTPSTRLDIPILDGGNYEYLANAGKGVQVYVLDSGIRLTHKLFGGRARNFGNLGPNDISPYVNNTMTDVTSHGTMVAGIVGAEMYGVAPFASLISVKVIDDYGQPNRDHARIAQALIDVTAEHNRNKKEAETDPNPWNFRGSVINMSFGWEGDSFALLYPLINANDAGITVFASAGNQNEDASTSYPCANVQTRCIAAVDATYNKWKGSNYGWVVDFVAPGKNILSLSSTSNIAIGRSSGTSLAAPHAAGAAAIFTSWSGLETHYDLSQNFVYWNSIDNVVTGFPSGTTTFLVNTGIHSPWKYPKEPFRWAGNSPHKPQAIDDPPSSVVNASIQSAPPSLASDEYMTDVYTDMATSTLAAVAGLTTLLGIISFSDSPSQVPSTTTSPTSSPDPTTGPTCATSGTPFAQPAAQALIPTFCAQPVLDVLFVPYIAMGNGTSQYGQPKSLAADGHFVLDGTSNVLWFRTRFTPNKGCTGSFNGTYQCGELFSTVLNDCQTNTITAKLGGTLLNVCAEYDLTVVDAHTDPFTDDDAPVGQFTCQDTPAPESTLYPNTCTCWMSGRAGQTAIFVRPANGVCDGTFVNQVDGLASGQGY